MIRILETNFSILRKYLHRWP